MRRSLKALHLAHLAAALCLATAVAPTVAGAQQATNFVRVLGSSGKPRYASEWANWDWGSGSSVRPVVNPGAGGKVWVVPLAPASVYSWPAQFYLNATANVTGNVSDKVCVYIIVTNEAGTYVNSTAMQCSAGSGYTAQTLTFEKISVPAGGTAYAWAIFYNSVNAWLNTVSYWSSTY
ncbi:hypothetical protein JY651_27270 [Pyxidicoccus parkwayensis]|uniref:Uncharacterized protein n=1 Tax=Pyxidicoccus parkwayensis TaxID=2813578 RepID=A0ABX7NJP2_9BACT|nr:hypothetical protein [Pyxidicoccus parkwaysis]QSQ19049.1 hypothetical protein JY651_27270 [Pyxidicoccus parkwaysis]